MPDNLTAKPVCLFFAWKPLRRLATRLFIAGGTLNFESYSAVSNNAYNKSLDASGGSVFRNLIGAAEVALIRAAASTQPLGGPVVKHSFKQQ